MTLRNDLNDQIPRTILAALSHRFDVIGDIAVLTLPPELDDYKHLIASTTISRRKNIRTVLAKITKLHGDKRTAAYEFLAGNDTITLHREFGFSYRLDVSTVFFSPRLASERKRVTDQVRSGERVLIPFCGVGPFAIPAAARGARVVAVEQNPAACQWLEENVRLNGVEGKITLIHGDAFDTSILPCREFDRAIVPTPYGMDAVLEVIAPLVTHGGMIHFYTFKKRYQIPGIIEHFARAGLDTRTHHRCGNVAPGVNRWVFDLRKNCI